MELIADTIDLSAYMGDGSLTARVTPAAAFTDRVLASFKPREPGARRSEMFSTKLAQRLEFRPGEVTVWAGYNGARKSTFTGQVSLDLCVQGERVMLASFEMLPESTMGRMVRQATGTARPRSDDVKRLMRWTDGRLWIFDHMGRITPSQCLAVCRYFATEHKGGHVFIDSMMMVCASEESLDEQKQFMTDVVRMAQETGLHVHLVAHCRKPQAGEDKPPTKYELRGSASISDQAHNIVMVWANKAKKERLDSNPNDEEWLEKPDAMVCVDKQRNGTFEGKLKLWWDESSMRFMNDRISPVEPYAFLQEGVQ